MFSSGGGGSGCTHDVTAPVPPFRQEKLTPTTLGSRDTKEMFWTSSGILSMTSALPPARRTAR